MLLSILLTSIVIPNIPGASALTWTSPQRVIMGDLFTLDPNLRFVDASPPVGTSLTADSRLKFVDINGNNLWQPGEQVVYDSNNDGQYQSGEPLLSGPSPSWPSLKTDPKVKLVDTSSNGIWDLGETVVYDSDNNNVYDSGETVIAGNSPSLQSQLKNDPRIAYVDSNGNNVRGTGEPVVYETIVNGRFDPSTDSRIKFVDTNNNNARDSGEAVAYDANSSGFFDLGETMISGMPPSSGTVLKFDSKVKPIDADRNGAWNLGEAVVYDANNNNLFDSGEMVVIGAGPSFQTVLDSDTRLRYLDLSLNNAWNPIEPLIYDSNNNNIYDASTDGRIKFYDSNGNGAWNSGESVVYDLDNNGLYTTGDRVISALPPGPVDEGIPLIHDSKFRFIDADRGGSWGPGESVVYDSQPNNVCDLTDFVVAGSCATGTPLSEHVIVGSVPAVGTVLGSDTRIRYAKSDGNLVWDPEEPVVYDANNSGVYDPGEAVIYGTSPRFGAILTEPVISGGSPLVGTVLKTDSKIRYLDSTSNNVWDYGESVVYDSNSNQAYDLAEPVIAGGAPSDGVWNLGESVVHDGNSSGIYNSSEPVLSGSTPVEGTSLKTDSHIKFVDSNANLVWNPGETAAYDSNNNNVYDPGDLVVSGPPPAVKFSEWPSISQDPLGRVWLVWNEKNVASTQNPDVFFKMCDPASGCSTFTGKQQVSSDSARDDTNFILALSNQTMMILWSSNSTGNPEIVYRLYNSVVSTPYPTTGIIPLTSNPLSDDSPSAVFDRNGRIWVSWNRHNQLRTISDIYYKYFNGTAWSAEFLLPQASSPLLGERSPSISQAKDGRIWIFWSSNDTGDSNLLYYSTTDGTIDTLPPMGIPAAAWSTKRLLFSDNNEHDRPTLLQARDGALWVFFQVAASTSVNIKYGISSDNGSTWSGPNVFSDGTDDLLPAAAQLNDRRIWALWTRQSSGTPATDEIWFTRSEPISNVHDVGLRNLRPSPRFVRSGDPAPIIVEVTVSNYGDFQENTQLTLKYNTTVLTTIPLTMTSGETRIVTYNWTPTSGFWGKYQLTAILQPATGENSVNQGDNSASGGLIRISPPGDVDRNGSVNFLDIALLAYSYQMRPGDPRWNPDADVDRNGVVDFLDLAIVAYYYGKSV